MSHICFAETLTGSFSFANQRIREMKVWGVNGNGRLRATSATSARPPVTPSYLAQTPTTSAQPSSTLESRDLWITPWTSVTSANPRNLRRILFFFCSSCFLINEKQKTKKKKPKFANNLRCVVLLQNTLTCASHVYRMSQVSSSRGTDLTKKKKLRGTSPVVEGGFMDFAPKTNQKTTTINKNARKINNLKC